MASGEEAGGRSLRDSLEGVVVDLLRARGPLTGAEIAKETGEPGGLRLWKACRTSPELRVRSLGTRYMRFERGVEGFARLSPSILREFLTYSVVGLAGDPGPFERRCGEVADRIRGISSRKLGLARRMAFEIMEEFRPDAPGDRRVCFIIAGDIVHNMAHDVPRPERSTGKLVKGSDIDLVVVVGDDFPDASIERLDRIIHGKKYRMLIDPAVNEEVDYIVKRLSTIERQALFDDFRRMVAVKILHEGALLHGSEELFDAVKAILRDRGLVERLEALERQAEAQREAAEADLLSGRMDEESIRKTRLFHSAEEFEEFE